MDCSEPLALTFRTQIFAEFIEAARRKDLARTGLARVAATAQRSLRTHGPRVFIEPPVEVECAAVVVHQRERFARVDAEVCGFFNPRR